MVFGIISLGEGQMESGNMGAPKRGSGDYAHMIVKAGLSAIPIVGGPAAELFNVIIVPPLERRREEWLRSIAEGLAGLERRINGFTIESLSGNEMFVTAIVHASRAALGSHQREKLEALRNAILNIAGGRWTDEDLHLLFLELVDSLTPWHLRILRFWQDPISASEIYARLPGAPTMRGILEEKIPELRGRQAVYEPIVRDLVSRGLIVFQTGWEGTSIEINKTTEFGDLFLKFIESPL